MSQQVQTNQCCLSDEQEHKNLDESSNETAEGFSIDEVEKMNNLNSNLDDLFAKIAMLTTEISESSDTPKTCTPLPPPITQEFLPKRYEPKITSNDKMQTLGANKNDQEPAAGLSMREFNLGKTIGEGKFGTVHECLHLRTGMLVALKKIYRSSIEEFGIQKQIQNQVSILSEISHPNIVQLLGFFGDPYHFFLVMEYAHGKTLEKMFRSAPDLVSSILLQVLRAVEYLHNRKIIHRDIKAENIIYEDGVVKLLDFGYATYLSEEPIDTVCGTLDYASPEILNKLPYRHEIDLWALGVLTYELFTGVPPFAGTSREEKIKSIAETESIFFDETVPVDAQDFILCLLKKKPEQRMSIAHCLGHPFIQRSQSVPESPFETELAW